MAWFNSVVEVTFIDDSTGQPFAVTRIEPENLPESFELDTTVHIGDDDWSVVDASPKTRPDYQKSRQLTLRVRRVARVDLSKLLFSLPSICDALAPVGESPLDGTEYVLHEDDWRQFEMVSQELAEEVDHELACIRRIHEEASAEVGWRAIHVRTKPEQPICTDLPLQHLVDALGASSRRRAVTYRGSPVRVLNGYALTTSNGFTVYGVAPESVIRVLAISQDAGHPDGESVGRLETLARTFHLDLVYWCRCARVQPGHPLFGDLLRGT